MEICLEVDLGIQALEYSGKIFIEMEDFIFVWFGQTNDRERSIPNL